MGNIRAKAVTVYTAPPCVVTVGAIYAALPCAVTVKASYCAH